MNGSVTCVTLLHTNTKQAYHTRRLKSRIVYVLCDRIAMCCSVCLYRSGRMRFGERKKSVGKRKLKNQCVWARAISFSLSISLFSLSLCVYVYKAAVYRGCFSHTIDSVHSKAQHRLSVVGVCASYIQQRKKNFNSEENLFYITHTIDDSVQSFCWSRISSDVFVSLDNERIKAEIKKNACRRYIFEFVKCVTWFLV